jgi:site-specific DNA-cytosine methylase
VKIVELYCGIGGVAVSSIGRGRIVMAVDQNREALDLYGYNFDHPFQAKTVESLDPRLLQRLNADLWWASPPCQPFTVKGKQRRLKDTRARTIIDGLLLHLASAKPRFFAMENVPGFLGSDAHQMITEALFQMGYRHRWERLLCPSELGMPNKRRRFFMVAGREPLAASRMYRVKRKPLSAFLDKDPEHGLTLDPEVFEKYRGALDLVDPGNPEAMTSCFTAGYGKSHVQCGPYLITGPGRARYFSPGEVKALLGFPEWFGIPPETSRRHAWKLLGNSLSIPCVKSVLSLIPTHQ